MTKQRRIWLGLAGGIVFVGLATMVIFRNPKPDATEPVYNGKPVSFFIDRPSLNILPMGNGIRPLVQFPRTVDTRALPYLTNALHRRNSPLLKVSQVLWSASPVSVKNRWAEPLDVAQVRAAAAVVIGNFGLQAEPAIPALIQTVKEDEDAEVRACAAYALGLIGRGNTNVVECLTAATRETNTAVGATARTALAQIQVINQRIVTPQPATRRY